MITIKEVARLAGVSTSTVSKVINNYRDIGPETKERVLRVIEETHFLPNRSARRLVQKKSKTVGFILGGIENTDTHDIRPVQLMKGALEYIQNTGYEIVFLPATCQMQLQTSYDQICHENNLAGVVVSGLQTDDPYYREASESELPCVSIDFALKGARHASVLLNDQQAAHCAMDYLIAQNHREIGLINGKKNSVVGLERYYGYCQSLTDHDIAVNPNYIVFANFQQDTAYVKAKRLLKEEPQITALFCASDVMALGVYHAAAELGRRIPDDLSIVAFDDMPIAPYVHPPLTTLRQYFDAVGSKAVELLLSILQNTADTSRPVYSNFELIVRDSARKISMPEHP